METSTTNKVAVSVVLPSYNELANIKEAIDRILATLGDQLLEIIIVDDDSPDETWKLVEELNHPKVQLIRRVHEKGLASALKTGVESAQGDVIVWLDCDLGIPPEEINNLVNQLDEYDVAIGSRFVSGGSDSRARWTTLFSHGFNIFARLLLGSQIRDYTSGFIAVKKEVLTRTTINPVGFGQYFIEFAYRCYKNGYRIIEIGYAYGDRKGGVSKSTDSVVTFFILGVSYIRKVLELKLRG